VEWVPLYYTKTKQSQEGKQTPSLGIDKKMGFSALEARKKFTLLTWLTPRNKASRELFVANMDEPEGEVGFPMSPQLSPDGI
jgi:hypothetical protein